MINNTVGFKMCSFSFFAEEEGSSFEDVEHNENILTLSLIGKWASENCAHDRRRSLLANFAFTSFSSERKCLVVEGGV